MPADQIADDLVDFLTGRLLSALFLPGAGEHDGHAATRQAIERLLRSSIE